MVNELGEEAPQNVPALTPHEIIQAVYRRSARNIRRALKAPSQEQALEHAYIALRDLGSLLVGEHAVVEDPELNTSEAYEEMCLEIRKLLEDLESTH